MNFEKNNSPGFLKRSLFSIITNVIKAFLSLLTGLLIARGLGPNDYGILTFLLASFAAIGSLFDVGTSSAFFSFISKKSQPKSIYFLYSIWLLFQFSILFLFISFVAPTSWINEIWQGQMKSRILLAFFTVFIQQKIWTMMSHICESQRLTYFIQLINLIIAFIHFGLIFLMYFLNALTIKIIFIFILFEFVVATFLCWKYVNIRYSDETKSFRKGFHEYKNYCSPLLLYTIVGFFAGFLDTWLLQRYGGSIEQAYYGVGYRFSAISLIALQSIIKVLWKEVSELNEKNENERVANIYIKTNHSLFLFGVFISGMFIPWSSEIISLTIGKPYLDGSFVLALMFLYPIHQSLGQINSTMYYALELTKPHAIISIFFMFFSILLAYFFIGPSDGLVPGLNLGSTGLALKMILIQFLAVSFSNWWLHKNQGWEFSISYQFVGIAIFILTGFGCKLAAELILSNTNILSKIIFMTFLYIILSAVIIYSMPWLLKLTRIEIKDYIYKLRTYI